MNYVLKKIMLSIAAACQRVKWGPGKVINYFFEQAVG